MTTDDMDPLDRLVLDVVRRTGLTLWRWTEFFFDAVDIVRLTLQRRSTTRSSDSSDAPVASDNQG